MVTTNDQEGEVDLEQRLSGEWQNMLSSQQAAAEFLSSSQKKPLGGDQGQVAFFNNKLDINRFFVDEGDSNDVPKVFFSQSNGQAENGAADAGTSQQP